MNNKTILVYIQMPILILVQIISTEMQTLVGKAMVSETC